MDLSISDWYNHNFPCKKITFAIQINTAIFTNVDICEFELKGNSHENSNVILLWFFAVTNRKYHVSVFWYQVIRWDQKQHRHGEEMSYHSCAIYGLAWWTGYQETLTTTIFYLSCIIRKFQVVNSLKQMKSKQFYLNSQILWLHDDIGWWRHVTN